MSKIPAELLYTKDHEWVKIEGKKATIGITDHAQHELTDIVFVELPKVGKSLKVGEPLGVVESVKSASEIVTPVSGKVIEVNDSLKDSPETVNQEPYGEGWMVVMEVADRAEAKKLMKAADYAEFVGE